MNKIKRAKQQRIASGLAWRFRAIELLLTGGANKEWDELTHDERVNWFMAFIKDRAAKRLEQQND